MSSTQRSTGPSASSFKLFSELPTEIQLMVWRYLVPNPLLIHGAIPFVVDLELGSPKAILPSIGELKHSYNSVNPDSVRDDSDDSALFYWDMSNLRHWKSGNHRMEDDRRPILSLLHTCQTSRTVALEKYRLDLVSIIPEENKPLWSPEEDIVYFPPPYKWPETRAMLHWFSRLREAPPPSLSSLRHVALQLDKELALCLEIYDFGMDFPPTMEHQWFQNFPALQSFTLFLDPCRLIGANADNGRILLHEPEDIPIERIGYKRASRIKRIVIDMFNKLAPEDREVPWIDVFVTRVRKNKKIRSVEG
jgi:hypothetical protein